MSKHHILSVVSFNFTVSIKPKTNQPTKTNELLALAEKAFQVVKWLLHRFTVLNFSPMSLPKKQSRIKWCTLHPEH